MLPAPVQFPALLCLLSVALLLVFERQGVRRAEWLFKPLAALAFIWAGLACGALDSLYGQWILLGLVLCMLGDVLLIPPGQGPAFLAGMAAFLLGHVGYAIAFLQLPQYSGHLLIAVLCMIPLAALVLRWLWPYLDRQFRIAVVAYVVVISAMVCLAVATRHAWIIGGALAFAASDLSVARNRFVAPGLVNRQWGLPLYFASQLAIAATIALV